MTPADEAAIEQLVNESRALRKAVHALVSRMRCEHDGWEDDLMLMTRRLRLTGAQRLRLRHPLRQRRPR
jgi:hypothetical protein